MPDRNSSTDSFLTPEELERFLSCIKKIHRGHKDVHGNPSECWEWIGDRETTNYGRIKIRRIRENHLGTHRVSLAQFTDFDIFSPLYACHHCDNRPCVNPDHLYPGTHQDNMDDMVKKGRQATTDQTGEKNGYAKLTAADVLEILDLLPLYNNKEIGYIYNVTHSNISSIRRGKNWSKLTGILPGSRPKYESSGRS